MMTRMNASPSVSGTNRKWYSAVAANCSRDRSTSSSVSMGAPGWGLGLGRWIRIGQAFRYGVGVGVQGMAIEKRVKNRRDHQQLDDDGEGDFPGQGILQEGGHGGL